MADIAKVRVLLESVRQIAIYLTDNEISDIGEVLLRASKRMELEILRDGE